MGKYTDLIEESQTQIERQRARGAAIDGPEVSPDDMGRAFAKADRDGMPPAVVAQHLADFDEQDRLDQTSNAAEGNPILARWLGDPNQATLAKDDTGTLGGIGRFMTQGLLSQARVVPGIALPYNLLLEQGKDANQKAAAAQGPQFRAEQPSWFSELIGDFESGWFTGKQGGTFTLPDFSSARTRGVEQQVGQGLGYGGREGFQAAQTAQAASQFGRQAEAAQTRTAETERQLQAFSEASKTNEMGTIAKAALMNPRAVMSVVANSLGSTAPNLAISAALPASRLMQATATGTGSGLAENGFTILDVMQDAGVDTSNAAQVAQFLRNRPAMEAARKKAATRGVAVGAFDALTAGFAGRLISNARRGVVSPTVRVLGEGAVQAAGGAAGEATAQLATEGRVSDVGSVVLEAAAEVPTFLAEGRAQFMEARQHAEANADRFNAQSEQSSLTRLVTLASESKTKTRSASRFESLIQDMTREGEDTVYIPAEAARTLYQSENEEGARGPLEGLVSPSEFAEAVATGGELAIPLAKYVTFLSPEQHAAIAKQVRLQPGTRSDIQAVSDEDITEAIRNGVAEAEGQEKRENGPAGQVYDEIYGQLLGKQGEKLARQNAAVVQSVYRNLAERAQMDAWQLFQQFRINIPGVRKDSRGAPRGIDTDVDPLLDALRDGKLPTDQDVFGEGFTNALVRAGGLQPDQGGELAALEAGRRPGLISSAGMTLDDALVWAHQEGFIQEAPTQFRDEYSGDSPDINTVLDLLGRDLSGNRVTRPSTFNPKRAAFRESAQALQEELDQRGIDLASQSNQQIREALGLTEQTGATTAENDTREAEGLPRLYQSAIPEAGELEQLRARVAELEKELRTDRLTGLRNQRAFDEDASLGWPVVSAADMDGLKRLNDSVGHEAADEVLRVLGGILLAEEGDGARFYRRSGDEFAARFASQEQADRVMADLQARLEEVAIDFDVTDADGNSEPLTYEGIGISYGNGADYATADAAANRNKAERLAAGVREEARAEGQPRRLRPRRLSRWGEGRREGEGQARSAEVTVTASTPRGEFRLTDSAAPAGTDFSEFGQVRQVKAFDGDQQIGTLTYANDGTPPTIEVDEAYRRRGVGTAMLKLARQQGGVLGDAEGGIRGRGAEYRTEAGQSFREGADEAAVRLTPVASEGSTLNQSERGSVTFRSTPEGRQFDVQLLAGMDASTFLHETGHIYLEVLNDLADRPDAPQQLRDDRSTILQWFGAAPASLRRAIDAIPDRMELDAKRLSDLSVRESGGTQADGLISAEPFLSMFDQVASAASDPKVRRSVVSSLPVEVVDVFRAQKLAPEDVLHDSTMLKRVFTVSPDQGISIPVDVAGALASLVRSVARHAAESELGISVGSVGREGDAAGSAEGSDLHVRGDYEEWQDAAIASHWRQLSAEEQRQYHEKFARGWEQYAREGKAPTSALTRAFAAFKVWLTAIYRSALALNVELSDDVRQVFDRIVASDAEIAEARQEQYQEALITDAVAVGMTPEQFAEYSRAVLAARSDAEAVVAAELLRAQLQEQQAWYRAERKALQEEVTTDLRNNPVYRSQRLLRTGKLPDGSEAPDALRVKFNKDDLLDRYGQSFLRNLRGMYSVEGGATADEVASVLGFRSGAELVNALVNAPPINEAIKAETDARMAERHPDPMVDGTLPDRAMVAAHREKQAEVMVREIRALEGRSGGKPSTQAMVVKGIAKALIDRKKLRQLQPATYRAAEAKAGREAFEAARAGDWDVALAARRRQLLNFELFREAVRARNEALAIAKRMQKLTETKSRQRLGKAGGEYLAQIDGLLDRFDFKKITDKAADRRASLASWIQLQAERGQELNLPDRVMDEAFRLPYRELTMEQLREVNDAVVAIDHLARLKGKLLLGAETRDAAQIDAAMAQSVASASPAQRRTTGDRTNKDKVLQAFRQARVLQATATDIARELDGFQEGGAVWENTVGVIRDATNNEVNPRLREAELALAQTYQTHYTLAEIRRFGDKVPIPEVNGDLWSKRRILALAMNWGNDGNRQAILTQREGKLTQEQVNALLGRLDARDWQFVQDVWKQIDSYWPAISEAQRRRTGLSPEKVKASPFVVRTSDGQTLAIPGGYFPLKYEADSIKTMKAEAEDFYNAIRVGRSAKAHTKDGHTIERVGSGGRTVKLDTTVVSQHLRDVIRDLYLGDAVNYVNQVLTGSQFQQAVNDGGVQEYVRALELWLKDVAAGEIGPRTWHERAFRAVRTNFTASVLAFKPVSAALQITGLIQSSVVLGQADVWQATGQFLQKPVAMTRYAKEASPYLSQRLDSHVEAVTQVMNAEASRFAAGKSAMIRLGYWLIGRVQQQVDVVTWLAAENQGMRLFDNDVAKARRYADDALARAQSSGDFIDKNPLQRGTAGEGLRQSEYIKAITVLQSYMYSKGNAAYEITRKTNFKSPAQAARWAAQMLMLFTVEAIIVAAIRGKLPDDDDDDGVSEEYAAFLAKESASNLFGSVPGGGAMVTELRGYDAKGTVASGWESVAKAWDQATKDQMDIGVVKAATTVGGYAFGLPSAQINKTIDAVTASANGEDVSPYEYLTGPAKK